MTREACDGRPKLNCDMSALPEARRAFTDAARKRFTAPRAGLTTAK